VKDFKSDIFGSVIMECTDRGGGTMSSTTVEANLLLAILEKLTEISETNKKILAETSDINSEFPPS